MPVKSTRRPDVHPMTLLKYQFGDRMKSRYKYACTNKTGKLTFKLNHSKQSRNNIIIKIHIIQIAMGIPYESWK